MMAQNAVDVLARTLWGEARSCGATGMKRVANVIMNRAAHPRWWGRDVISVCQAPYQFSCWNAKDPNRPKILAVTAHDPWFAIALAIAQQAVNGGLEDLTKGADCYYALTMPKPPTWAARAVHTVSDSWHWFGRVELPAPSGDPDAPNWSHTAQAGADAAVLASATEDLNAAELARIKGA